MKRLLILFVIIFLYSSCNKKTREFKNSYLIPRDTLVILMTDMYLADGIISTREFRKNYSTDTISLSKYVFDKYNVSKDRFDSTINVYLRFPDELDLLYEDVLKELSKIEGEIKEDAADR